MKVICRRLVAQQFVQQALQHLNVRICCGLSIGDAENERTKNAGLGFAAQNAFIVMHLPVPHFSPMHLLPSIFPSRIFSRPFRFVEDNSTLRNNSTTSDGDWAYAVRRVQTKAISSTSHQHYKQSP